MAGLRGSHVVSGFGGPRAAGRAPARGSRWLWGTPVASRRGAVHPPALSTQWPLTPALSWDSPSPRSGSGLGYRPWGSLRLQAPGPEGGAPWGDEGGWGGSGGTASQGNGCLEALARWRLSVQQKHPSRDPVAVCFGWGLLREGAAGPGRASLALALPSFRKCPGRPGALPGGQPRSCSDAVMGSVLSPPAFCPSQSVQVCRIWLDSVVLGRNAFWFSLSLGVRKHPRLPWLLTRSAFRFAPL